MAAEEEEEQIQVEGEAEAEEPIREEEGEEELIPKSWPQPFLHFRVLFSAAQFLFDITPVPV